MARAGNVTGVASAGGQRRPAPALDPAGPEAVTLDGEPVTVTAAVGRPRSPRWSLPLLGGALFTAITAMWLTSALWFSTTTGLTF